MKNSKMFIFGCGHTEEINRMVYFNEILAILHLRILYLLDTFVFLAIVELSEVHLDRVKEISFDNDFPKRFVLTTDHHVLLFTWVCNSNLLHNEQNFHCKVI